MIFLTKKDVETMTSKDRVRALHNALKCVYEDKILGDFVECGIYKGGNLIIARAFMESVNDIRKIWGYDTFTGMTPPDISIDGDKSKKWNTSSKCEASYQEVHDYLQKFFIIDQNIALIKGNVNETLLLENNKPKNISILRLDTDFYDSTKVELETLYEKLSIGGYLIIDDYGHWQGCKKAVDDFFGEEFVTKNFKKVDYTCRIYRKK